MHIQNWGICVTKIGRPRLVEPGLGKLNKNASQANMHARHVFRIKKMGLSPQILCDDERLIGST